MFKQYILVAGVNYENMRHKLKGYCINRMERWRRANKSKIDLRFIIFDFVEGTIDTIDVTFVSGFEKVTQKTDKKFTPVNAASYTSVVGDHGFGFKRGQATVMSITDIYAAVQDIGRTNPGTLVELSFFSHGWMGGPILVNSCDQFDSASVCFGGTPRPDRDPDDKDPRSFKDFSPPNMSATLLKQFRDAFHPNGFVWLWGCTFPKLYFWAIHHLLKSHSARSLTDTTPVRLVFSAEEMNFINKCTGSGCATKPTVIDTDFKKIKAFICDGINNTYAAVIAKASGRNTFAALLGTYATYEDSKMVRDPLMKVEGFSTFKAFYDLHFSMKLDPAGLGYGTYSPSFSC